MAKQSNKPVKKTVAKSTLKKAKVVKSTPKKTPVKAAGKTKKAVSMESAARLKTKTKAKAETKPVAPKAAKKPVKSVKKPAAREKPEKAKASKAKTDKHQPRISEPGEKKTVKAKAREKPVSEAKTVSKSKAAAKTQSTTKPSKRGRPKKEPTGKKRGRPPKASKPESTPPPPSSADETGPSQNEVKTELRRKILERRSVSQNKTSRPVSFTLDEALQIAHKRVQLKTASKEGQTAAAKTGAGTNKKQVQDAEIKQDSRVLGAASVADILGFNPSSGAPRPDTVKSVPVKYQKYYKLLLELRDHVVSGLDLHTKETLKRSAKEDSGNLSAYSQHMADAGTDAFDRDFALNLVSSEQEALFEIEEAIKRIKGGTYGICEITGKPIGKERLLAVPFARYSVEGQVQYEKTHRRSNHRGGVFTDETGDETVQFLEEENDE